MAKIKSKIFAKIFMQKINNNDNVVYNNTNNNQPYFNNVIPPISKTNQNFNNINITDNNKIYQTKNVQLSSSYIIPLQEQKPINNEIEHQQNNSYYENPKLFDTMAMISFKTTFKIPKPISREIKIEKLKHLLLVFFSLLVLIVSSIFIGFYYHHATKIFFIPHPIITIPLLIISTTIALINVIEFFSLRKEVDLYIERTLKGSLLPPHFIINNYRKIHVSLIIWNWICSSCYVVFGVIIGVMVLISEQKLTFIVQSWTATVPNLIQDVITFTIILGVIFCLHMINIILFKFRKRNIISYYGYEIINSEELNSHKKKINRICMFIILGFLSLIFFAIVIPIWVLRRRKKK